ncbi:SPFH domain / Band 7 family protein [Planctomycetes bacterium Poly30]|uniref:SPFH domain / Band 7 family protein n=1 Tax=Saltatorellus ferox TaxID=2528018 RepID=A0A518ELX7_9BACT|nr:SPFH domain / Band 7 family protein [Planctomycetes bacterium Poly30]
MSKTIDVEGSSGDGDKGRGFDPPWEGAKKAWKGFGGGGSGPWGSGGSGGGGRGGRSGGPDFPDPPPLVKIAGGVFVVLLVLFTVLGLSGKLGIAKVEADEIAVRVNYLSGTEHVVSDPGYQFYIPFLMDVYKLDGRTQEYLMKGDSYQGLGQAPYLTVRAIDGSNFWFDELKIQYEVNPDDAGILIRDSGLGDNYKEEWIKSYARSILRDEFGRYSAVDVADPTVYKQAPEAARAKMNEILGPHGIRVVRIITPNPQFDENYERAIEMRKEADQEVEELRARVLQIEQEREQRLAKVRKEKEVEMQELTGQLTKELLAAEQSAIRVEKSADAFAMERIAEGTANEARYKAEATGLVAKYTKEAEGIESKAKALEQRGEVVVREALVQKLLGVKFTLVPYSRDPSPERLEHSGSTQSPERMIPADEAGGN